MKWMKYLTVVIILNSLYSCTEDQKCYNVNNNANEIKSGVTNSGAMEIKPERTVPEWVKKILELNKARIGNSRQIVLVTNEFLDQKDVDVQTFEQSNDRWIEKFTLTRGTIGRNGFARYREKKEGDGKTPTGIFYFGPFFSYPGLNKNVSTKMEYWEAGENDYWIDDGKSDQYNRWVTSYINPAPYVSCELMKRKDDKYKYGVAIQYNMDQIIGKGSVIVLHVLIKPGLETAGCITIPEKELIDVIEWLDPVKKPILITGTVDEVLVRPVSESNLDNNDKYIWKKEIYTPPAK